MGSPHCSGTPPTCSGISVERLKLQRNITKNSTQSFGGILNEYATQSSYANEVTMSDLMGTGLLIEPDGSGPYTNIYYLAASTVCSGPSNSRCVDIEGQTQGLHGITCIGDNETFAAGAGIIVNASNNSVEGAHLQAFSDGIEIAQTTSNVANVVVSNVSAGLSSTCSGMGGVTNAFGTMGGVTPD